MAKNITCRAGWRTCLWLTVCGGCWLAQEGDSFRAQITIDLGSFPSAEEAALAHDRAAVWTLGVMAGTNLDKRKQLLGHGTCECLR